LAIREIITLTARAIGALNLHHRHSPIEGEPEMKIQIGLVIVGVSLGLASMAFGQSADAKYCHALAEKTRAVTAGGTSPPAEVPVAISKCDSGDAGAISTLEKYLRDNKQELPKRG
jgi:hypothetical protein